MNSIIQDFVNRRVWAVVGVSTNRHKYGNIIFRDLRGAGYQVYGVHPDAEPVEGETIYATLADLPVLPEVVDIVVPPEITEQIVQECQALGLTRVWMQPGAESEAAIEYCHANGIRVIAGGPCAMVQKRRW